MLTRRTLITPLFIVILIFVACSTASGEDAPIAFASEQPDATSTVPQTESIIADSLPAPTSVPSASTAWVTDRNLVPVRTDWPRSSYHDQFDDCTDHGYGGRILNSFYFIELPAEPYNQEEARQWLAEHLCMAGRHDWAPPGHITLMQGHFTMAELKEWFDQMHVILSGVPVSFYGYQNMHNWVGVGLLNMDDEPLLRERLDDAGIPQHAVHFEQASPFSQTFGS